MAENQMKKYVLKMYFSKGKKHRLLVRIQPCTCNHSPGESEMGAWVQGEPRLYSKTVSQKQSEQELNLKSSEN